MGNQQKLQPRFDGPLRVIRLSDNKTSVSAQHITNNKIYQVPLDKIKLINVTLEQIKQSNINYNQIKPTDQQNIRFNQ